MSHDTEPNTRSCHDSVYGSSLVTQQQTDNTGTNNSTLFFIPLKHGIYRALKIILTIVKVGATEGIEHN